MQELTALEKRAQISAIGSILSNTRPEKTYRFPGHDKPITREQWLNEGSHEQQETKEQHTEGEQVSLF